MHLAVVSLARTGSTVLAQVLAKKFDLKLLGEIHNSNFPDPICQLGEISVDLIEPHLPDWGFQTIPD